MLISSENHVLLLYIVCEEGNIPVFVLQFQVWSNCAKGGPNLQSLLKAKRKCKTKITLYRNPNNPKKEPCDITFVFFDILKAFSDSWIPK